MHIPPKDESHYPWYVRIFFWSQKRKYGKVLLPGMIWGRVPQLFAPLALLYGGIDRRSSPISPQLRSLITVRVSQINWCAFCVDINSNTLEKRGCSLEKIQALPNWKESSLFDEKERVALAFTEAVTITDQKVDDALMVDLKKFFDDDTIVDLTGLIAFQNMSSKFNSALAVPPQGFCLKPDNT